MVSKTQKQFRGEILGLKKKVYIYKVFDIMRFADFKHLALTQNECVLGVRRT